MVYLLNNVGEKFQIWIVVGCKMANKYIAGLTMTVDPAVALL
jgi:hypothetical protein